jgi:hypothetical protein
LHFRDIRKAIQVLQDPPIVAPTGLIAATAMSLSPGPPRTTTNAAGLLDPAQISLAQTVVLGRMFACGLEAMLRDGSANLIALTGRRRALRVALGRQQPEHNCN